MDLGLGGAIRNERKDLELNFIIDNDSQLFLDAQEAKKVSKRTVVR